MIDGRVFKSSVEVRGNLTERQQKSYDWLAVHVGSNVANHCFLDGDLYNARRCCSVMMSVDTCADGCSYRSRNYTVVWESDTFQQVLQRLTSRKATAARTT